MRTNKQIPAELLVCSTLRLKLRRSARRVVRCLSTGKILSSSLQTFGATDWESFQVDGRYFLVVANSQKVWQRGPSLYNINSTVYELNTLTRTFIPFQDILTHR